MSVLTQVDPQSKTRRTAMTADSRQVFAHLAQVLARRAREIEATADLKALVKGDVIPLQRYELLIPKMAAELPEADAESIAKLFDNLATRYPGLDPQAFCAYTRSVAARAVGVSETDTIGVAPVDPVAAAALQEYSDPTDAGLAAVLLAHNPDAVWVTKREQWMRWDGQLYAVVSPVEIQALLIPLAEHLTELLPLQYRSEFDSSDDAPDEIEGELKAQRTCLKRLKSARSGAAVVDYAKRLRHVPWEAFDADQGLVSFANGVLDLRTQSWHAPSQEFRVTRGIRHACERPTEAQAAAWLGYLASLQLSADVVTYLQRLFGYALAGYGTEKAFAWLLGESGTGKSTFAGIMADVFDGYAARVDSAVWMRGRGDSSGHTDALMPIAGARYVWCDEVRAGSRFDESRMKQATSGAGSMRLSAKGERGVDVRTRFLLTFSTDVEPSASEGDTGLFARMRQVCFTARPTDARPGFAAELVATARPAIVAWLLAGAYAWITSGLGAEPVAVVQAREDYASGQDWLKDALTELYVPADASAVQAAQAVADRVQQATALRLLRTTAGQILQRLDAHFKARGGRVEVPMRLLTRTLRQMGYTTRKSNGQVAVEWITDRK